MKIEDLIKRYEKIEHFVSPAGLIFGFFWHLLNLKRIDLLFDNLLVVFYLCVTALAIIYFNAHAAGRLRGRFFEILSIFVPFVMQFSIGGLFSSFVIFYGQSGALSVSWPFLLILVFMVVGNEVFRKRYQRLAFQISIFFATVFLYLVFAIPILIDKIGDGVFLLSGVVSLFITAFIVLAVSFVSPQVAKQSRLWLALGIGGLYAALNILYFFNIIPPIPLALKDGGIAHSVSRAGFTYSAQIETPPWYLFLDQYNPIYHWTPGETVYCYAAIFAPTKIRTNVYHRWLFYDEKAREWVEKSKIKYSIIGGRDGGYRGYSYKQNIEPGKWRVDVMNERGQVLGRLNFEIVQSDLTPELVSIRF